MQRPGALKHLPWLAMLLDRPADWAFLVWSEAGLVEVDKPAPGEAVDLPWSPGPMGI